MERSAATFMGVSPSNSTIVSFSVSMPVSFVGGLPAQETRRVAGQRIKAIRRKMLGFCLWRLLPPPSESDIMAS
jgi:hypothetical protein